jgi:hypothetical protein
MAREIAAAVIHFDQNRDLLPPMGAASARHIAAQYSHQRFVQAIRAVYAGALGEKSAALVRD